MKKNQSNTEGMIHEIFRLCDKTVWCEDWLEFQGEFEKILKKRGYNLWKIYFGVPSARHWRIKCRKSYEKYVSHQNNKKSRERDSKHYYIKNRAYKIKTT